MIWFEKLKVGQILLTQKQSIMINTSICRFQAKKNIKYIYFCVWETKKMTLKSRMANLSNELKNVLDYGEQELLLPEIGLEKNLPQSIFFPLFCSLMQSFLPSNLIDFYHLLGYQWNRLFWATNQIAYFGPPIKLLILGHHEQTKEVF